MSIDRLIQAARRARKGPSPAISPAALVYALRSVLDCMVVGGAREHGNGPIDVGSRVLAAIIADLEEDTRS
jgi:hypothetical protein